ncbi:MAG TPA: 16S rRNA (cytosine(1402)-N(4))-methyltransferase RsmH [Acidiferrobacterales bacterium]
MEESGHRPVLLEEAVEALNVQESGRYVDATFGRGGHSGAILARLGPDGRLLSIDRDPEAVASARARFGADPRFDIVRGRFSMLSSILGDRGWAGRVDGVLLDLGVSSPQLDAAARGFSLRADGPLDMRMDPDAGESAADWLNRAAEDEIARVLRDYGEERYARRIARAICRVRAETPIATTRQLAELIARTVPTREPGQHPATRSFQALRIQVNGELDELRAVLPQALDALAPGGRLAVISFHSLEDRIVKRTLRAAARGDDYPPDLPVTADALHPRARLVGKARRASEAEVARNPRARSAVLRVAEVLHV